MLLQLVSANPSLPQSMRDTAQSVAQNAINEATKAIGGTSVPIQTTQTVPVSTYQYTDASAPTISYFNSSASTITAGQSVMLSWASNAANCHVWRKESNGGYTAIQNNAGSATSVSVVPTMSSTYVLNCYAPDPGTGKDAPSAQKSVYIAVKDSTTAAPTIYSFTASPSIISSGQATTLSWSSNAANCDVSRPLSNDTLEIIARNAGSATTLGVSPVTSTKYTLYCYTPFDASGDRKRAGASVHVSVGQGAPSCTLTADKSSYAFGETITFTWTSKNANYAMFVVDDSGKDNVSVPSDKGEANGSWKTTANVYGYPYVTVKVVGPDNQSATCTKTVNVY